MRLTAECLTILGDFAAAKTSAQKAFEIAELADHQFSLVLAYRALGAAQLGQGEAQEAFRCLEPGLDRCREGKNPVGFSWVAGEVGRAYALTGRISEALDVLQQGVTQASLIQMVGLGSGVGNLAYLGHAYLHGGKVADALSCSEQALEHSRIHGLCGSEAEILRILGEIRSVQDLTHAGLAETLYHEAMAAAEPRGMRPLVAHCHFGLGKLYRRTGKQEQAREHLTTTTMLYREMGMTFWLGQAEAEIRELG
jgi:tetratricopeptide (TPR) repeat protein